MNTLFQSEQYLLLGERTYFYSEEHGTENQSQVYILVLLFPGL